MPVHEDVAIAAALRSILDRLGTRTTYADTDDLFDRGVIRSLDMIEMITAIEDAFGIEVAQRDVFEGHLRSVERLVAYVGARGAVAP